MRRPDGAWNPLAREPQRAVAAWGCGLDLCRFRKVCGLSPTFTPLLLLIASLCISPSAPLAVGIMVVSMASIWADPSLKGKAVIIMHLIGDQIWYKAAHHQCGWS